MPTHISTKTLARLLTQYPYIDTAARHYIGWGFKPTSAHVRAQAKQQGVAYTALEDAFIRSFELVAKDSAPLGVLVDEVGVYYCAEHPSQLENWLDAGELSAEESVQASQLMQLVTEQKLSKYNAIEVAQEAYFDSKTKGCRSFGPSASQSKQVFHQDITAKRHHQLHTHDNLNSLDGLLDNTLKSINNPSNDQQGGRRENQQAGNQEQLQNNIKRQHLKQSLNKAILVIDQVKNDDSIRYGMASTATFEQMLETALNDNPDAQILLKVHPDVYNSADKQGCIDLQQAAQNSRIRIVTERINPWDLFELVDKVYTVTSQMGFEALLAFNGQSNKEVHCFGMPFYAGWGLTHDRQKCERRIKQRSVEEIFYFAYVKYAHYINPFLKQAADLEHVCHIIVDQRRHAQAHLYHHICLGFSSWKKAFVADFLQLPSATRIAFVSHISRLAEAAQCIVKRSWLVPYTHRLQNLTRKLMQQPQLKLAQDDARFANLPARIVVWASSQYAQELAASNIDVPVLYMEDGFLRSVGLGADLARPYSLITDTQGIYYDATRPSDLESLLQYHEFFTSDLHRAAQLRQALLDLRLSKYNFVETALKDLPLPANKTIILVPGQVENDASIKKGCVDVATNLDLLKVVRAENPQAYIVYKPHPDVIAAGRRGRVAEQALNTCCDHVAVDGSIIDWLERVDEVHTMTSLTGFEALLRGKKVVCYGMPFYAGWGLTQDRHQCQRRTRKRGLDELVAAALIYYPTYVDPASKQVCNVETIVQRLKEGLDRPHRPSLKTRLIRRVQRVRFKM